jgi:ER membrane protein complex subunit 7
MHKRLLAFSEDGQFAVEGVASGSYVVEIANADYIFEPVRVDITSKGKIRARRLNLLQVLFANPHR